MDPGDPQDAELREWIGRLAAPHQEAIRNVLRSADPEGRERIAAGLTRAAVRGLTSQSDFKTAIETGDADTQEVACWLLGLLADSSSECLLAGALVANPSRAVRHAAASALVIVGTKKSGSALRGAIVRDEDPEVRAAALQALGMIGGPTAFGIIRESLLNDHHPVVRGAAAEALQWFGAIDEAAVVLQKALRDPDPQVRGDAAHTLGLLHASDALPDLRKLLADDAHVAAVARQAIDRIHGDHRTR